MAEEKAVTVARQFADAFAARDLERMVELSHPEIEYTALRSAFEGKYQGHDGVRRWVTQLLELAPDYWITIEELRPVGDTGYVMVGRQGGTAGEQKLPFDAPMALVGELRDGLVVRVRAYEDGEAAFEAAGLSSS